MIAVPTRPPRACAQPGCPETVVNGSRCTQHVRAQRAEIDSLRPSAARRGYDHRWRAIRAAFLRRNPLCVECERFGMPHDPHAVLEVDHIDGDVTNCAHSNLRTLCKSHHSQRTARDQAFGRRRAAR